VTEERFEDFLGPLPTFAPDLRQESFLSRVGASGEPKKVLIDQRLGKVEIANIGHGWPASAANLGFLQAGMARLIELGKLNPQSKKEVTTFVSWAVQRVIRLTLSNDEHPGEIHVRFWTRDDRGAYEYAFPVVL